MLWILGQRATDKDRNLEEELEAGTSGKDSSLSLSSVGRGIGLDFAFEAEAVDFITFREGGCGQKFYILHQT